MGGNLNAEDAELDTAGVESAVRAAGAAQGVSPSSFNKVISALRADLQFLEVTPKS